jgi:hypothetical protein
MDWLVVQLECNPCFIYLKPIWLEHPVSFHETQRLASASVRCQFVLPACSRSDQAVAIASFNSDIWPA